MTSPNTLLADAELDRLETLLEDPALEDAMRLDQAQGYLCAALSGPEPMASENWLAEIIGGEEALATPAGQETAALLQRFAAVLEEALAAGEPPILLLYPRASENGEDADEESDYAPWCEGYLAAVDAAPQDWFEALGADPDEEDDEENEEIDYLDEQLFPLLVLSGEAATAASENGEEWPDGEELISLEDECEESLPQAVVDIYRFWLAKRGVEPLRRGEKVGRNEPCPCGSGKKYKNCCGA